jgi:hypothetical protein
MRPAPVVHVVQDIEQELPLLHHKAGRGPDAVL